MLDFVRKGGGPSYAPPVNDCSMAWGYSIDFRKRAFIRLILAWMIFFLSIILLGTLGIPQALTSFL